MSLFCIYNSLLLLQKAQPAAPATGTGFITGVSSFLLPLVH